MAAMLAEHLSSDEKIVDAPTLAPHQSFGSGNASALTLYHCEVVKNPSEHSS